MYQKLDLWHAPYAKSQPQSYNKPHLCNNIISINRCQKISRHHNNNIRMLPHPKL